MLSFSYTHVSIHNKNAHDCFNLNFFLNSFPLSHISKHIQNILLSCVPLVGGGKLHMEYLKSKHIDF